MTKIQSTSSEASPSAATSATSSRKRKRKSRSRSASAKTTTRSATPTPSPRAGSSPSITFIVPTVGRIWLAELITQLRAEIGPNDQVIVIGDGRCLAARGCTDGDPRMEYHEFPGGRKGNPGRDYGMTLARCDWLMFIDDDDLLVPGALSIVRKALAENPDRPHFFRVVGLDLPGPPYPDTATGATFIVPNNEKAGKWDFDQHDISERQFIRTTLANYPDGLVPHEDPIYMLRPYLGVGQILIQKERLRSNALR